MSDIILISKVGLYETIKCAICKNPNQTERGCDGACQYDKELHEKIVEAVMGLAEQRPHGEWERIDKWVDGKYVGGFIHKECPMIKISDDCLYSPWTYNFCPNCGAKMISSNSEIEKSKSEIIPDYRDGWRMRGEAE